MRADQKKETNQQTGRTCLLISAFICVHPRLIFLPQQASHDCFLHVQPVFRFIDYYRRRRINHAVSNYHVAPHRQTVHEDRIIRARHLLLIDNPLLTVLRAFRNVLFRSSVKLFRTPTLRIDNFGAVKCRIDVPGYLDAAAGCRGPPGDSFDQLFVELVTRRMGDDEILEVWAGTEGPTYARMSASAAAGIGEDRVRVHVPFAGGSFGLHSTSGHDPVSEAVQVARALEWKYPVKVQSLREEELKSGRYRAMAVHRVRAGADAQGRLTAFHQQIAAEPTSPNMPFAVDFLFKDGVDYMTTSGAVDGPYAVANFKLETTNVQTGVPIMVWRSVGNSHTEFARESAIDELAAAAGRDPVDLRRDLLAGNPRTLRALELAAGRAGWGTPLPEGHARGVACSSFLDSHSAQVTEVSLDNRNRVHIEKVTFALDCGITVNPDLVRAQVEGGLIWALGAAAWGEAVLGDGGQIITQNFDRYPVMRMQSVPRIDVHLIESGEPPTGVGEVSVPSAAPALTSAIAALTGTRIRQLPITKTIRVF